MESFIPAKDKRNELNPFQLIYLRRICCDYLLFCFFTLSFYYLFAYINLFIVFVYLFNYFYVILFLFTPILSLTFKRQPHKMVKHILWGWRLKDKTFHKTNRVFFTKTSCKHYSSIFLILPIIRNTFLNYEFLVYSNF